jgi:outer membrane protein OmpA-like peptidoglycan-associated protein
MKHHDLVRTGLLVLTSGLALAACSSTPPPNAALEDARHAYATASGNPTVQQSAPRELENAQESLGTAQAAYDNNDDKSKVDHYAYVARRYSEIAQEAAKVRTAAIQATTTARVLTLSDMLFATGKANLNGEGIKAVDQLATFLRNYPDRTVVIMGYTDSTGSAKINAALSQHRAAAVQQALINDGIDSSRIQARGLGPTSPVASNDTAGGRQQNRRVEVAISGMQAGSGVGSSAPR